MLLYICATYAFVVSWFRLNLFFIQSMDKTRILSHHAVMARVNTPWRRRKITTESYIIGPSERTSKTLLSYSHVWGYKSSLRFLVAGVHFKTHGWWCNVTLLTELNPVSGDGIFWKARDPALRALCAARSTDAIFLRYLWRDTSYFYM